MSPVQARDESWVWDYFSIKDDGIGMSVCNICGEDRSYRIYEKYINRMRRHLSTKHTDIYDLILNKNNIHWESHFKRMEYSTDNLNVNIKCNHCNKYNDKLLRGYKGRTMKSHLKKQHNVTENDRQHLLTWRNKNTGGYYDLTEESIKRTRVCKKCSYQFRRSNLCIMIKHLIQGHDFPDIPLDKLPKGLIPLNYPVDAVSSRNLEPSTSGRSDSSPREPASKRSKSVIIHSSDSSPREPTSKRSKISHNASSDEEDD